MKKKYILIMLLSITFLVACSKNKEYIDDFNDSTTQAMQNTELLWSDIDVSLTQCNTINQTTAYSNSGIYYIANNHIYYYDFATQKNSIWCNKLECSHDNYECSSYVYPQKNSTGLIFYQSGKIYLVARDEDGYFLESYNEDGSNYQVISRLWTTNSAIFYQEAGDKIVELTARVMAIDRGKVYYAVSNMKEVKVYEMDLMTGSTPKEIGNFKDEDCDKVSIDVLKVSDTYVTLAICKSKVTSTVQGFESYETEDIIYAINRNDYSLKELGNYNVSNYTLYKDELYAYETEKGFFKLDISSGKKSDLSIKSSHKTGRIFIDDNFIVVFVNSMGLNTEGQILIYDYNYKLLETITTTGMEDVTGFDGRFVYGYKLYDYKNTPDNNGDDMIRDAIWPIEDLGKSDKRYYYYDNRF